MGVLHKYLDIVDFHAIKKVRVRSVKLGLLNIFVSGIVVVYIIGYQILYKSRHFASALPTGTARIQAQRPVKNHCNVNHPSCDADFTSRKDLHYCSQSQSTDKSRETIVKKHPCEYWDEHQMNPIKFQGTIVMPTRVTFQHQHPTHKCDIDDKDSGCKNIFEFTEDGNETFIADVERFTLLIDHAFTMPRDSIMQSGWSWLDSLLPTVERGSTVDFPGFWEKCQDPIKLKGCELVRIPCLPGTKCDGDGKAGKFSKHTIGGTIGLSVGDVIPVGALLDLAGIQLDNGVNAEGESWRESGVALQIDVDYENRQPFKWDFWRPGELHYIYRVSKLPVESYKNPTASLSVNGDRVLQDTHGIFISVRVGGNVAYVDATQMQLLLATFVSLLAVATLVINQYAESLWSHRDTYMNSKYDTTVDLNVRDTICGIDIERGDDDLKKTYATNKTNDEFVQDLIGLDGEALRYAAMAIFELQAHSLPEHKVDEISRQMGRSFVSRKSLQQRVEPGMNYQSLQQRVEPALVTTENN